jgi:hypothetical protein
MLGNLRSFEHVEKDFIAHDGVSIALSIDLLFSDEGVKQRVAR